MKYELHTEVVKFTWIVESWSNINNSLSNGVASRLQFDKVKQGGVILFKENRPTLYSVYT